METEIGRWRCIAEDQSNVIVIEYQHVALRGSGSGLRRYPGARRFVLSTGEVVRYIDGETFEVTDTGELLRRST